MNSKIPYKLFGTAKSEKCIFLHGNGFPPETYSPFLQILSSRLEIYAMYQKPFWKTDINPNLIYGWEIFQNDALQFLEENNLNNSIAIGHSMGAILILLIEIKNPGTFKRIFLLDPVITSPLKSILYKILLKIGLIDIMHPMIKRTNKKKMIYHSPDDMYNSYRTKNIFSKINNDNLKLYINSILKDRGGKVEIKLSKNWENAIYRNGSLSDAMIWKEINKIKVPTYIITPGNNEFGHFNYGSYLKNKNKSFINLTINDSTHLFPIERPKEAAELILSK